MKRKLKLLLFILFLFTSSFYISHPKGISADAGWDSDYDSGYGGSSGGGSYGGGWYDDDDDYGYNRNSSSYSGEPLTGGEVMLLLIITGVLIAIPISINVAADRARIREDVDRRMSFYTDSLIKDKELNEEVFDLYKKLNIAWMNKDLEPVRHLLTDEMYNTYLMQIDELIEQGETNVMKDFDFVTGGIVSRRRYAGKDTVTMLFRVKCKDYVIDSNKRVLRGKKNLTCDYLYELRLEKSATKKSIVCPSCGNTLENNDGVVCPHCETIIHTSTNRFRLANKRMVYQTRYKG